MHKQFQREQVILSSWLIIFRVYVKEQRGVELPRNYADLNVETTLPLSSLYYKKDQYLLNNKDYITFLTQKKTKPQQYFPYSYYFGLERVLTIIQDNLFFSLYVLLYAALPNGWISGTILKIKDTN